MNRKKHDKNLIFKVNEDEWNIIQKRLEKCNVSNMSDLFRQMMLYGIYLEYDHEELKKNTAGGYACGKQRQSDCTQSERYKPYLQTGTL